MRKKPNLNSSSAKQAVAILAVDNIKPSVLCLEVLKRVEDGIITYEQAKDEILQRASAMTSGTKVGDESAK